MSAEPLADDLSECVGCSATFPTPAALTAHVPACATHPLAPQFARQRALEAAVVAWVAADAAHGAYIDACRQDAGGPGDLVTFRAVWAAEARLRALVAEGATDG
jgi:hypothetical protein